eukprot:433042-Pyramimonas_sp.AAC.1
MPRAAGVSGAIRRGPLPWPCAGISRAGAHGRRTRRGSPWCRACLRAVSREPSASMRRRSGLLATAA